MSHVNTSSRSAGVLTNPLYDTSAPSGRSGRLGGGGVTLGKGEFPPAADTKAKSGIKAFFKSIVSFIELKVSHKAQAKASIYSDVQKEVGLALRDHDNPAGAFMRGADSPGIGKVMRQYSETYNQQLTEFASEVSTTEIAEHRESKFTRHVTGQAEGSKTDAQIQDAADAVVRKFDEFMTMVVGGTDEESIASAAAQLPQAVCDLVATAHKAIDDKHLDPATAQSMKAKASANMIFLRNITPAMTPLIASLPQGNPKRETITNVQKLCQNMANNFDPTKKEPCTTEFKTAFGDRFNDWSEAMSKFMDQVAERGVPYSPR